MIKKEKIVEIVKMTRIYNIVRSILYDTKVSDYNGVYLGSEQTDEYMKELLTSNKPCMISRFGSTELKVLKSHYKNKKYSNELKYNIKSLSGVFPTDDINLDNFSNLYFEKISHIDLLAIWFNPFEDELANKICPNARLTKLRNLEPYFSNQPWSIYLKGKKVLVVHPFTSSIKTQYKIREKLFVNKAVLPEFELITYQAIQSLGGNSNFESWFEALEYMQNDIAKIEFDIAIIGAGAYGLPLASYVKEIGKKAIHLGGATQMLFGVYGQRWAIHPDFQDIINEHWVKPTSNETPKTAKNVENACYW